MKLNVKYFSCLLLMGLFFLASGCKMPRDSSDDSTPNTSTIKDTEVKYRETSGSISPVWAWEEIYTISYTGLIFERKGYTTTSNVNIGTWTINGFGINEEKLFNNLPYLDICNIKVIGQDFSNIGGGIKQYNAKYENGFTNEVIIGSGDVYNTAGLMTIPVDEYITHVTFPANASSRFK